MTIKAVGVQVYAGGFTLGMREYMDVLHHVVYTSATGTTVGSHTAKLNLRIPIHTDPKEYSYPDGVDVVYGSPPCVLFRDDHDSLKELKQFVDFGLDVEPKIWAWACVPRVFEMGSGTVQSIVRAFNARGYKCTALFTDTFLHGACQRNEIFFLIASKVPLRSILDETIKNEVPGGPCAMELDLIKPEVDVKNLNVRKTWQWMERYSPAGMQLRKVWFWLHGQSPDSVRDPDVSFCPLHYIVRLHRDLPAPRVTAGPNFIHPTEWRMLSPGEMAALSGFPRDWKWSGNFIARYQQVALGVSPLVGRYLGKVFAEAIDREPRPNQDPEFGVVDFRKFATKEGSKYYALRVLKQEWFGIAKNNQLKEPTCR